MIDNERVNKNLERDHERAAEDLASFIEDDKEDLEEMYSQYAYEAEHQVADLVHKVDKFDYSKRLDQDHLITMLPAQLQMVRRQMD